jgi:hypothetical protein
VARFLKVTACLYARRHLGSKAEVVQIQAVDAVTGEASEHVWFGVAANGRFGSSITRSARSFKGLAEMVEGSLTDERALWDFVLAQDPTIGTWDGEPVDPLDRLI